MVYLYDEYFKANPREQKQVLNKFIDSEKNLHEMSLDELNKDVQQDGIKGYDIDFTEEDMDVLMEYKNLTALSNRKKLVGYKYIRSVTENVDEKLITHPIMRLKGSDYIKYLTRELNYKVLYEYGVFNRIFNYENEHNCIVQSNSKSPDWFLLFVEELLRNTGKSSAQKKNNIVNDGTTNKYRKRYINYRITRKTWIKLLSDIGMDSNDVIVQKLHKEYLIKK